MATTRTQSGRPATRRGEAREKLLKAARALITTHGVDGTSIRAINAAAGVSPGVLHYHFGSQEALVSALLDLYVQPLMEQRARLLDELQAKNDPPSTRDVANVLVMPLAKAAIDEGKEGLAHVQLLARLYSDNNAQLAALYSNPAIKAIYTRLFTILLDCNPGISANDIALRMDLAAHVMLRGLSAIHTRLPPPTYDEFGVQTPSPWHQVENIIDFMASGLSITRNY